jgi:hypothetical protein
MERVLEPEWLDSLPPYDARAQRSRADLRRVNALMGNARHVATALADANRIADLGAGDGSFMQCVARRLRRPGVEVTLVDRMALPDLQWEATAVAADVHEFLSRPGPRFDAIVANLFLHHFEPAPLRRLLALAARRTPLFVACEPRRSRLALQASRLLGRQRARRLPRPRPVGAVAGAGRLDAVGRPCAALRPPLRRAPPCGAVMPSS